MKEAEEKIRPLIEKEGLFKLLQVNQVNHKPHQYMIGSKHIVHASDHHGGMLDKETLRKIQCAHPGCRASYEEHTYDTVAFVQLTKNVSNADAKRILGSTKLEEVMKANKVDGFALVDTEEKFRVV
jgi:hypothetical protein